MCRRAMDVVSTRIAGGSIMKLSFQREMHIGELDKSIIAMSKRKLKLLQEIENINQTISFLRQQQEDLYRV